MSGSDRDSKPKRPPVEAAADDPWAKWRQSEMPAVQPEKAGKATVSPEKRPKSKSAPFESAAKPATARAVRQKPEPAAVVPAETPAAERVKPEGTLGVRKSAVVSERPINRKPIRGGAVAKRTTLAEKAASAAKPAGKPERLASRNGLRILRLLGIRVWIACGPRRLPLSLRRPLRLRTSQPALRRKASACRR